MGFNLKTFSGVWNVVNYVDMAMTVFSYLSYISTIKFKLNHLFGLFAITRNTSMSNIKDYPKVLYIKFYSSTNFEKQKKILKQTFEKH